MNLDLIASERERTLGFIDSIKKNFQSTKERKALSFLLSRLDNETLPLVTTTYVSNDIIEICNSSIDSIEPDVRLNEVKLGGSEFIFLETPIEIEGTLTKRVHFLLVLVNPKDETITFLAFESSDKINGCLATGFDSKIGDIFEGRYVADDKQHHTLGRDKTQRNYTKLIKYYLAICSWRSSKIIVNDSVPVSRGFRKRATHKYTDINIIRLRRTESSNSIGTREYKFRWIVRGFFRRQWYPKSQTHKLIFVDSFVKGPVGAELRVRQQIHLVVK